MKISNNKVVGLTYELRVSNAEKETLLVEKVESDHTFYFLYGNSGLPEDFEKKLIGLEESEKFEFSLTVEEGFGKKDEESVVYLPKEAFEVDGVIDEEMLQEDNFVPMMDERGHQVQGKILKIEDTRVLVDFNHPLVDMNLHFKGEVVVVREATPEEIAHGHVHGEGGHSHDH
jgi:FKBP-type peptidyl-prolyl cis-trans isomerase SlyD